MKYGRFVSLFLAWIIIFSTPALSVNAQESFEAVPYGSVSGSAEESVQETGNGRVTESEKNEEKELFTIEGAAGVDVIDFNCKSALLMEAESGKILYAKNAEEAYPPASVTKIMTLLLVMEAIDSGKICLDDKVTASAHAASMGGSQIFLKEGEQMSVEDMLKSVVIASANDAALALAEHISGSEESFVSEMNKRASELGMKNTVFENTNGLDDTVENHVTSAKDIAIMSRELIKHNKILEYSSLWMDTVRGGEFGLTNTNRLVRFYRGCTGLKTGSTEKAGFCISATADRDGMSLICVIMGAPTRDARNAAATSLLDWGYAKYGMYSREGGKFENISISGGKSDSLRAEHEPFSIAVEKNNISRVESKVELPDRISAPVKKGEVIGRMLFTLDGKSIGECDIVASEDIERIDFLGLWVKILARFLNK